MKMAWVMGWSLTTLLVAANVTAAETTKGMPYSLKAPAGEVSVECPASLTGVNLNIESTFAAPRGWTPKPIPTGYNSLTLTRSHHAVQNNMLWCTYARSSANTSLRTTSISKPAPVGKTCTATDGFRFSCK